MSKVRLYIATSLDGYIADRDGGVGWLDAFPPSGADGDYGYAEFYASIDCVVMGRKTYEQALTFGEWPERKPTYVFSHDPPEGAPPRVEFIKDDPAKFIAKLWAQDQEDKGDVWLMGGGKLIASFRERGLIDEYILSVIPVLLGEGLPLFEGSQPQALLRLLATQVYTNGVVQLRYEPA